ncbi:MAG: C40 family peptidase [Spirochaetes bacterium]|jgi:cell wall-associated NlpC family hydrolase|nr:C40 family peptidase [Spirochaetota bacterium]
MKKITFETFTINTFAEALTLNRILQNATMFLLILFLLFTTAGCELVIDTLIDDTDETEETDDPEKTTETWTSVIDTDLESSVLRDDLILLAREQIGIPYLYGGATPSGFDCSGLIYYVYGEYGFTTLPRTSRDMYSSGTNVGMDGAKLADIVAFYSPVSHVGMMTSSTTFIHAPSSGKTVTEAEFAGYWERQIAGVVTYIDDKR